MPANQHFKSIHITSPGGVDQDTISNPNYHDAPPQRSTARREPTVCSVPNNHHTLSKATA